MLKDSLMVQISTLLFVYCKVTALPKSNLVRLYPYFAIRELRSVSLIFTRSILVYFLPQHCKLF